MGSERVNLVVGLGLNSRATLDDVLAALDEALASIGRARTDVATLATAEHRRGHPALGGCPLPIAYFPADRFTPGAVAERAAQLGAPNGELIVPKRCTDRVCVAIVAATRTEV